MRCRAMPCVVLVMSALGPSASGLLADDEVSKETLLLRVSILNPAIEVAKLARQDLDIAGIDPKRGTVDVVGDRDTYDLLRAMGFSVDIDHTIPSGPDSVTALSDYRTPAEANATLDSLVATYPTLAKKIQYATTGQGRPVWALKISDNVAAEEDEPAIFFVAQHHAREVMTPEIALDIADYLLSRYASDPKVATWVDGMEIFVLPNHNPDGTSYVFTNNSSWRKNRRANGDGSFGVDPNRNYPFKWGACGGSSGSGSSDTYRGPSPASEPETFQGIIELARQQRPVISLSYHTYSELVIMPFGCQGSYTSENQTFRRFSSDLSTNLVTDDGLYRYVAGAGWEILYAVDGEMDDWFYGELGTYALTIEANSSAQGFQPDYGTWRDSTVERNRPGWQYTLDRIHSGPSVHGHVTDACSGAPLSATISLDEVTLANGETPRISDPVFGRFQWLATPGAALHVRAVKPGYATQVRPVAVDTQPVDRPLALVPSGSDALAIEAIIANDAAGDDDGEADPGELVPLTIRLLGTGAGPLSGVAATLTTNDPFVTVVDDASSYGTVGPGAIADGDGFVVQIAATAPDEHEAVLHVAMSASAFLCAPQQDVVLRITKGRPSCPFVGDTLDANPGWTIQNVGSGGWAFGAPAGNGGSTGPAAPFSGTNVYGTNLSGNYGDNGSFLLTTGAYDLRGLRHAQLRYARWLDNEAGYDLASAEISTDGGGSWQPIWSGFAYGEGWQPERFDIGAIADQEADVRFRFRLESDSAVVRPGFYLDDLAVCGESVPSSDGRLVYDGSAVDDSSADGGNDNGVIDAGETISVAVGLRSNRDAITTDVEAFLTTSTPGVTIRNGYARFPDIPAGGTGTSLGPHFSLSVDDTACGQTIAFTLSVRWAGGGATTSAFNLPVGTQSTLTVLGDDFETDLGWTAGVLGATAGFFVREDPHEVFDAQDNAVQPEDDTTADPGATCWVTLNPLAPVGFDPLAGDVDKGTVWVQSPTFDGENAESLVFDFSRWFVRRNPNSFDASEGRMRVSRDDGTSWVTVRTYNTDSPQWVAESLDLVPYVSPSAQMRVRFEVQERFTTGVGDTLLEGLLDDVRIDRTRTECAPFNPPALQAPHGVGNTVLGAKTATHVRVDWSAPPTDASHDAATLYRVYRSAQASGGFAVALTPTASFAVFADELYVPSTAYFLVVAENNGGTSGDVPAP